MQCATNDIMGALKDLDKVIELNPENSLTYFNRAIIRSQIGDYSNALSDYEKVININPNNVLGYYNRAAVYMQLGNYRDAIYDYNKAIELYPDFANAYLNRSYAKRETGELREAKEDYDVAQLKINEYRSKMNDSTFSIYADTSKTFNKLLALDADFSKQNFRQDLAKERELDMTLKPLFRVVAGAPMNWQTLDKQFFHPQVESLKNAYAEFKAAISNRDHILSSDELIGLDSIANERIRSHPDDASSYFEKAIVQGQLKQFTSSLNYYSRAIELDPKDPFLYINRSTINSEMVDFISSIDNSIQTIVIDNTGGGKTRTKMDVRVYNYEEAIADLNKAVMLSPDLTYTYYNRANLQAMSSNMPEAIDDYSKAIQLYPYFAEAYFNRGLIQLYLKDTEKGCLDISKAGELGISDAYAIIKKFCTDKE